VRIAETFHVARTPEAVFDYVSDPVRLGEWQTASVSVEALSDGPRGPGSRFRERLRAPAGREFEQITEYAVFERPTRFGVHVVQGPQPIDGTWTFSARDGGTDVTFVAEGELRGAARALGPLAALLMRRQFAGYHRRLRRNLERA
jgi:hypothetical protein